MKTNQDVLLTRTFSTTAINDSSKLMSLLALAAGAAAMPQTGHADIIYTDLSSNPVTIGYGSGVADYTLSLPGSIVFKFERKEGSGNTATGSLTYNYRWIRGGDYGGGGAADGFFKAQLIGPNAYPAVKEFGAAWDQGEIEFARFAAGFASDLGLKIPNTGYNNKYYAWKFQDSTQGNALRYGWMEVNLAVNNYPTGPNLTILRYGWDNTGAQPTMGQLPVPEPSSAAIVALGAMALGARGVRNWRQKRNATPAASE